MAMAEGAGHALACDLMGSSPSDNGLVLSLVFEQMADHRRRTVLDVGRARRRKESFSARDWIACAMTCKFWNSLAEEFLFKAVCESLSVSARPAIIPRAQHPLLPSRPTQTSLVSNALSPFDVARISPAVAASTEAEVRGDPRAQAPWRPVDPPLGEQRMQVLLRAWRVLHQEQRLA